MADVEQQQMNEDSNWNQEEEFVMVFGKHKGFDVVVTVVLIVMYSSINDKQQGSTALLLQSKTTEQRGCPTSPRT